MVMILIGAFISALKTPRAYAEWTGTVYIRADGTIDPPDAPIITYDRITYTLTGNITSTADGIFIDRNNIVIDGAGYTISGSGVEEGIALNTIHLIHNVTVKNTVIMNFWYGINLFHSSNNSIIGNSITNNVGGIWLEYSAYNSIIGNSITNHKECGIGFDFSSNNVIYHNNFISNNVQVERYDSANFWDDGYPSGGNYWSDYTGVDLNNDGIGDTPYMIDASNQDNYPLVAPISVFNLGVLNSAQCKIAVISNSVISNVQANTLQKTISFNVFGTEGTVGFCRLAIPNTIVQDLWQGNYMVLLNGEPWPFNNWTDTKNTYIYINYTHSTHEIVITPEFPSTIILAIFMLTTSIATTLWKTKRKRQPP
jgi:parallel beta-helix repeat protein